MRLIRFISLITLLSARLWAQDTLLVSQDADSPHPASDATADTAGTVADTGSFPADTTPAVTDTTAAVPAAPSDTTLAIPEPALDSFSVVSDWYVGIGAGLSLGSLPPLGNWKAGLAVTLADAGLPERMIDVNGDTVALRFTVKENPDAYNMMFPVAVSAGRMTADHRFGMSLAFAMLTKNWNATVELDSLRSVTIAERMRYLSLYFAFDYGTRIPEQYFSVDKVDRTDAVIGLGVAPLIGLSKSFSHATHGDDPVLASIADTLSSHWNAFDASGIALVWRIGITTVRRASLRGAVEAGLHYQGSWCTRFRSAGTILTVGDINAESLEPQTPVSWFSSRFEITLSLLRKIL